MKVNITINTDNAAFEDNPTELLQVLQDIAEKIRIGYQCWIPGFPVKDSNGNTVGQVTITE